MEPPSAARGLLASRPTPPTEHDCVLYASLRSRGLSCLSCVCVCVVKSRPVACSPQGRGRRGPSSRSLCMPATMRVKCPRGAAARGRVRWVSRAGLSEVCPSVRMVACSVLAARVGLYCPRGIAASHATRSPRTQLAGRQVRLRGGWTQSETSRSVKNGRIQKNRILITQVSSFIHTQGRHDPQDSQSHAPPDLARWRVRATLRSIHFQGSASEK